jgi:hypothetical protein
LVKSSRFGDTAKKFLILPFQQVKPFTLHCSLLLLIFVYAFAGGVMFNRLEAEATEEHHRKWGKLMRQIN